MRVPKNNPCNPPEGGVWLVSLGRERGHMIGVKVNGRVVRSDYSEYRGVLGPVAQRRGLSGEAHE